MLMVVRPVFSLFAGVSLLLLGSGLLNTLLAVRGSGMGFSDPVMGLIMSGYFVGFLLGTYSALPVIRRVGHIRAFAMWAALGSVSVMLHEVFDSPWVWGALRVLTGMALVTLYTVIESWLNAQTPGQYRGQVFAIYMIVNLVALSVAQQFLQLAPATSYLLFGVAAMLVTLSLVPVTWTRFGPPPVQAVERLKLSRLWHVAPVAVLAALCSGLAMGAFWGMSAVYASRIELDSAGVASFMTFGILGGARLQYPISRLSDRLDRRKVLMVVAACAVVSALLLIPASMLVVGTDGSGDVRWIYAAIALYGGLAFTVYPLAVAHLIDHLSSDDVLAGGSAILLVHGLGASVGPALSGQLMALGGPSAWPVYLAVVQLVLAGVCLMLLRQRQVLPEPVEESAHFVPMVRTTPTALEMHPDEPVPEPNDAPSDDAPSDDAPSDEVPSDKVPSDEVPSDEVTRDETPLKT